MAPPRKKRSTIDRKNPLEPVPVPQPAGASRRKWWGFRLVAMAGIPLMILGLAELTLRLAGFGYPTAFMLPGEREGQKVLVQNNQFGWRFFGPAMARMPEPFCLPAAKNPEAVRIIVFGESAALGDPQPAFGLPRMLQALLELRHPGRRFEVVNAGIVAIDSNVILPLARDCARANADVWVVYMGNNEVVGPFGAGTVFGRQCPPRPVIRADLALKSTRLGELLDLIQAKIKKPPTGKSEWGGMEMFLNQEVRADDPRMAAVYQHFSENLADIVRAGRQSGAGVVVSTVAVNMRDCAPFASEHQPVLTRTDEAKWNQFYQNGVAAQANGKMDEAARYYGDAARLDDRYAELRFRQGCCALALGDAPTAQRQFAAARDLDTLRFRCDSQINDLIRRGVADEADSRVVLADAERSLAEHSQDGLPGNDLFYEHVHLTFHGNYLLALALAPHIEGLLPPGLAGKASPERSWPSETDCARRLAWSDWDRQKALTDIYSRLLGAPFTRLANHDELVHGYQTALEQLAPASGPAGVSQAKAVCESALATAPDDPLLRAQLAELDQLAGDLAAAEINERQAVQWLPGNSEDWSQLGVILAKQKKYEEAAAAFRHAVQLNPEDVWAMQNVAQSLKGLGRRPEAIREYRHALAVKPRFGLAWLGLGQMLEENGDKAGAEACYQKAVQNPIHRPAELATLAHFCEAHGWRETAATNYAEALALNPLDPQLYLEAGKNLVALGRPAQAEPDFCEAAKLAPDSVEGHFFYGMALGRAGKPAEAARQFREAVRLMPDMPEARFNLGLSLANAGDFAGALEQFDTLLRQNPGNQPASQYAQALRQKLSAGPPR